MDELKEKIAIAVRRAQSDLDCDMFGYQRIMFDVAAGAALRAIDEAGFAVVRKQQRSFEVAMGQMQAAISGEARNEYASGFAQQGPLNLEEPRG